MFVFINYNKAQRIQQTLKFIHYSSITTNSLIQLKVKKMPGKIIYWKFLFRGQEKKKRAEETEDVQQARLRASRKRNTSARQGHLGWCNG